MPLVSNWNWKVCLVDVELRLVEDIGLLLRLLLVATALLLLLLVLLLSRRPKVACLSKARPSFRPLPRVLLLALLVLLLYLLAIRPSLTGRCSAFFKRFAGGKLSVVWLLNPPCDLRGPLLRDGDGGLSAQRPGGGGDADDDVEDDVLELLTVAVASKPCREGMVFV